MPAKYFTKSRTVEHLKLTVDVY